MSLIHWSSRIHSLSHLPPINQSRLNYIYIHKPLWLNQQPDVCTTLVEDFWLNYKRPHMYAEWFRVIHQTEGSCKSEYFPHHLFWMSCQCCHWLKDSVQVRISIQLTKNRGQNKLSETFGNHDIDIDPVSKRKKNTTTSLKSWQTTNPPTVSLPSSFLIFLPWAPPTVGKRELDKDRGLGVWSAMRNFYENSDGVLLGWFPLLKSDFHFRFSPSLVTDSCKSRTLQAFCHESRCELKGLAPQYQIHFPILC